MAEEIAVENGRISKFEGLETLTLDRVTLHTVVHLSIIDLYLHEIEIEETFTYVRTYARTDGHLKPGLLGRLCRRVDLRTIIKSQLISSARQRELSYSTFVLRMLRTFSFASVTASLVPVTLMCGSV